MGWYFVRVEAVQVSGQIKVSGQGSENIIQWMAGTLRKPGKGK